MTKKNIYWGFLICIILGSLIFILGLDRKTYADSPVTVYQVYLNGETIGIIEDEDELYDLIDKKQKNLKNKYDVKKIYAPIGLETTKLVTYAGEVETAEEVYEKIENVEPFTVKGYEVTIVHSEEDIEKLNVLTKEDLDEAIENTIKAFVEDSQYEAYLAGTQAEIKTTGTIIEDISIREEITIKEKYISTEEDIFIDSNELSKYLLFGTREAQGTHVVNAGETINDIAEDYELTVKEFLIVNPEIISESSLLFTGQEVNVGLINPKISVVVENILVEDKTVTYDQQIKYDEKYPVGTTFTEQIGQNGLSRVSYYTETINGTLTQVEPRKTGTEVITPVVDEVIVKGGLSSNYIGDTGKWFWPTIKPYVITSYYGWRTDPVYDGREFHRGIDVSGTGHGSPIYAAQTGKVIRMGYHFEMGNYVYLEHDKGYQTIYMHLSGFASGLRVGKEVGRGETIGYMGTTGKSTGTHLDFRVTQNGTYINPLSLEYN